MIFAFPATPAPSERLLSEAGNVVRDKRTLLNSDRVEELVFLHDNYTKAEPLIRRWKLSLGDFEPPETSTQQLEEEEDDVEPVNTDDESSDHMDLETVSSGQNSATSSRVSSPLRSPASSQIDTQAVIPRKMPSLKLKLKLPLGNVTRTQADISHVPAYREQEHSQENLFQDEEQDSEGIRVDPTQFEEPGHSNIEELSDDEDD